MLACNALFAAYEMALASISRARISVLQEEKKKGAVEAAYMKDRMEASLAIIQLGITLVGALAAAAGGAGAGNVFAPYFVKTLGVSEFVAKIIALLVIIIPYTFLTIIFGELVPKMFALKNKERVVLTLSPFMRSFAIFFGPVINVIEVVVKFSMRAVSSKYAEPAVDDKRMRLHELKSAVSLAKASRVLGVREERLILSAAQLTTRSVGEICLPAKDIFTINLSSSLTDAFLRAHLDMHTRFPVCEKDNDPQTIIGYINFKDIVVALKMGSGESGLKSIIRSIVRLERTMTISEALERILQERTHIALVVDGSYVLGLVTLEDIMEELLGELEDEFDRPSTHMKAYGPSWLMGGGVPITTAVSKLGLDWSESFKDRKVPTLEEWCEERLSRPLEGGEVIEHEGVRVVPRKFRRKQLLEAVVKLVKN
jgi:putative hemolysin